MPVLLRSWYAHACARARFDMPAASRHLPKDLSPRERSGSSHRETCDPADHRQLPLVSGYGAERFDARALLAAGVCGAIRERDRGPCQFSVQTSQDAW